MTRKEKRDGGGRVRPPRLAGWLLRRALPRDARAASIAGDLIEEFHVDVASRSRAVAAARYWRHALSIAARYAFRTRPVGRAPALDALHASASGRPSVLGALREDLRDARRSLIKHPGFSAVAVLTLAVGVGADTAIFSVLHAVVLRDLPYHDADRLAVLWTLRLGQNLRDGSSYPNFRDWKERSRAFEDMAVCLDTVREFFADTGRQEPERVQVALVGPGFFRLLGAPALLGRALEPADFDAGRRAVVISHSFWRQRFGGTTDAIGKSVDHDGMRYEVVGVMAPDFALPSADVQAWTPLSVQPESWRRLQDPRGRAGDVIAVLGRLRPTATFESAQAELDTIAARLRHEYPDANADTGVLIEPLTEHVLGSRTAPALWLLFGAVGFVLLIACANVANLALARGTARRHELSIRTALGASKRRLVRQALTENLVLAVLAASVGLLFAGLVATALGTWAATALPRLETVRLDLNVFLFALVASLASGLVAGVLPALQSSTVSPVDALRDGGARLAGGGGSRLRHGLVIAELALAVVLLSGAGLLIRSFVRVQTVDRGFDSRHLLLLQVALPDKYDDDQGDDVAQRAAYFREAFERIRRIPGVAAAGAVTDFFIQRNADQHITIEGQPRRGVNDLAPPLTRDWVIPGYFEALRVPLLHGRLLRDADLDPRAPPVAVINETMARAFWPGKNPVGERLKWGANPDAGTSWTTVVGVVADMTRQNLDEPAIPYLFAPGMSDLMDIVVRTVGDPDALRDTIRAELRAIEPTAPPYGVVAVEQQLWDTVALRTLQTMLLAALAAAALILAVIGVYGVIHQSVVARTQEIGVRMALGASKASVLRMILSGALGLSVTGLTVGMIGALALAQTLSAFLYQTSPLDPLIYLAVALLLVVVTMAACLAPASRAARVDPMTALRYE